VGLLIYQSKFEDEMLNRLFEAVLLLRSKEECYRFFEDICTIGELKSMAQRLEVAKMLCGEFTYGEIATETGASTATISRVKKCLHYGADGYKLILERLSEIKQ